MEFEKASKMKLRFATDRGMLSTEDLWDLTLAQLNRMAKTYNKELKASSEEDFLEETSAEDAVTKLQFTIVRHVLEVRKEEKKSRANASTKRAEKERLLALVERKQHESDEGLSEEELLKKIADL